MHASGLQPLPAGGPAAQASGRVSRRWSHARPRPRGADPSAARAGNKFMLGRLLPRFLKSAKTTLTGDVSNHVVVVALGPSARNVCSGLTARYSHQCVEDPDWDGPEGQYDVGDEWFMAVSQNKLELVLNVMTLGYSVLWRARPASQDASPDLPTCMLMMLWAAPICSKSGVVARRGRGQSLHTCELTGMLILRLAGLKRCARFMSSSHKSL